MHTWLHNEDKINSNLKADLNNPSYIPSLDSFISMTLDDRILPEQTKILNALNHFTNIRSKIAPISINVYPLSNDTRASKNRI